MLNIELPWIDGYKLIRRWYPLVFADDVDYEELHHCIFELGLPVYNFKKKLQEGIVDEVEIACDNDGIPLSCYPEIHPNKHYIWGSDKRNALFFFDRYVKKPHIFDPKNTFFSRALARIRTKDRTHLRADIVDILKCMYFKMEEVKQFEVKHAKKAGLTAPIKDTGIVIPKIEVPWMNGKRLMERWGINLDELYQAIFSLHLPVYDSYYNKQDRIIWEERTTTTGGIYGDEPSSFTLPPNNLCELEQLRWVPSWPYIGGESVDEVLCSLYFTIEDVKEFEVKHGMGRKETSQQDIPSASHKDEPVETDAENFVRNLRVSYENDSEIEIQEPGKKSKKYRYDSLGFSNNRTKEWKAFINVLHDPPHIYETGVARDYSDALKKKEIRREYGRRKKRLAAINKKLISFFNKEYPAKLPKEFRFDEACKEEGAGKNRFKFQVSRDDWSSKDYRSIYEQFPADELIDEIKTLAEKHSATNEQVVMERLIVASKVAMEKRFLSDDDVKKMFDPDASKEKYLPDDDLTVKK